MDKFDQFNTGCQFYKKKIEEASGSKALRRGEKEEEQKGLYSSLNDLKVVKASLCFLPFSSEPEGGNSATLKNHPG